MIATSSVLDFLSSLAVAHGELQGAGPLILNLLFSLATAQGELQGAGCGGVVAAPAGTEGSPRLSN